MPFHPELGVCSRSAPLSMERPGPLPARPSGLSFLSLGPLFAVPRPARHPPSSLYRRPLQERRSRVLSTASVQIRQPPRNSAGGSADGPEAGEVLPTVGDGDPRGQRLLIILHFVFIGTRCQRLIQFYFYYVCVDLTHATL